MIWRKARLAHGEFDFYLAKFADNSPFGDVRALWRFANKPNRVDLPLSDGRHFREQRVEVWVFVIREFVKVRAFG